MSSHRVSNLGGVGPSSRAIPRSPTQDGPQELTRGPSLRTRGSSPPPDPLRASSPLSEPFGSNRGGPEPFGLSSRASVGDPLEPVGRASSEPMGINVRPSPLPPGAPYPQVGSPKTIAMRGPKPPSVAPPSNVTASPKSIRRHHGRIASPPTRDSLSFSKVFIEEEPPPPLSLPPSRQHSTLQTIDDVVAPLASDNLSSPPGASGSSRKSKRSSVAKAPPRLRARAGATPEFKLQKKKGLQPLLGRSPSIDHLLTSRISTNFSFDESRAAVLPPTTPRDHNKRMSSTPALDRSHSPKSHSMRDPGFAKIDDMICQNATYKQLFRLIRMCSAQNGIAAVVTILEKEVPKLVASHACRVLMVQHGGFVGGAEKWGLELGFTGLCRTQGKIIFIANPHKDPRCNAGVDCLARTPSPACAMYIPVLADTPDFEGSHVIAVLQLFRVPPKRDSEDYMSTPEPGPNGASAVAVMDPTAPFTEADCKTMYRFCELLGNIMMGKTAQFEAQQYQSIAESIVTSSATMATDQSFPRVTTMIVTQLGGILQADSCHLVLVAGDGSFETSASFSLPDAELQWDDSREGSGHCSIMEGRALPSVLQGLAQEVFKSGEVQNFEPTDRGGDPASIRGYLLRHVLVAPLVDDRDTVVGLLIAVNKSVRVPGGFTEEDERVVMAFCWQAVLAVNTARLIEAKIRADQHRDALLEVTYAVSQELQVEDVLSIIVAKALELLRAERAMVFFLNKNKKELYTSSQPAFGTGDPLDRPAGDGMTHYSIEDAGIAGGVVLTGKAVVLEDAYSDPRFNRTQDELTGIRTGSLLVFPIKNGRLEVVGVLQLMDKKGGKYFDKDDLRVLRSLSIQAAVAIDTSTVFRLTESALNQALADQRNMQFKLMVTENMSTDVLLTSLVEQLNIQVHHLLKSDSCAFYLLDAESQEYYEVTDQTVKNNKESRFSIDCGTIGRVMRDHKAIVIIDGVQEHPDFDARVDQVEGRKTCSILSSPIMSKDGGSVLGAVTVRDEAERGGFNEEEEELLRIVSAQASVVLMNCRNFEQKRNARGGETGWNQDNSAQDYLRENGMKIVDRNINDFIYTLKQVAMHELIGTGSYGEVYRGSINEAQVAVKRLHRKIGADQVDAFCKEASLMCQLKHPNIVGYVGAVTDPQNLCIITEYCVRGSLADLLLDERLEMNHSMKLQMCIHAASGMAYLHNSNPVILHRDLKSDNLLVGQDWTVKVADFGLTRFLNEKTTMTQVGTPIWMAPEIILGQQYTEKADVYAFGIIMWEILTRQEPYPDKESMAIVVAVVNDDLRPEIKAEHADDPLIPIIKKAWGLQPEERPPFATLQVTLSEMLAELIARKKEERRLRRLQKQERARKRLLMGNSPAGSGTNSPVSASPHIRLRSVADGRDKRQPKRREQQMHQEIKLGSEPSVPREDMVGPGSMLPIRPLRNPSLGPET